MFSSYPSNFVYLFREIHELSADLDVLTQILSDRYSNDPDVGQWIAKYSGIYYGRIQQYLWNSSDLQREFSTLKEQYEKLKTENDDLRKQLRLQQNPVPKK